MSSATQTALQPGFRSSFLQGLAPAELREVVGAARAQRFRAHHVIANGGDWADRMFVLTSGRAQTYHLTEDGVRLILHTIGPGEIAGGAAAMRIRQRYLVTTEMSEEGDALVWQRETIRPLLFRYPLLFDNAMLIASGFVAMLMAGRISMVSDSAEQRLAEVLVLLGESGGRHKPSGTEVQVTNEALADRAHISPFTASRVLSEWARRGVISRTRGRITIHSPRLLAKDS